VYFSPSNLIATVVILEAEKWLLINTAATVAKPEGAGDLFIPKYNDLSMNTKV
jgi:hypothetical protein